MASDADQPRSAALILFVSPENIDTVAMLEACREKLPHHRVPKKVIALDLELEKVPIRDSLGMAQLAVRSQREAQKVVECAYASGIVVVMMHHW